MYGAGPQKNRQKSPKITPPASQSRDQLRRLCTYTGHPSILYVRWSRRPAQLDYTGGGVEPISEGRSLISLCRGPIQMFVWWGLIQIAENCRISRRAYGGRGSLAARAVDTYRQKSCDCRKKRRLRRISEVQPDLRGSLIVPRTVKLSCAGRNLGPLSTRRNQF
jgi:hypothetical protein